MKTARCVNVIGLEYTQTNYIRAKSENETRLMAKSNEVMGKVMKLWLKVKSLPIYRMIGGKIRLITYTIYIE